MAVARRPFIALLLTALTLATVILVTIVALMAARLHFGAATLGLSFAAAFAVLVCTGIVWRLAFSLVRQAEETFRLALTDAVTGLGNERAFEETIRSQAANALRHDLPVALALFNLVDTRGQDIGREIHKEFAELLCGGREGDRPFRLGENTYALLLPYATSKAARTAVERMLRTVPQPTSPIAVRVGIAMVLRDTADALMQQAREALFRTSESSGEPLVICDSADGTLATSR